MNSTNTKMLMLIFLFGSVLALKADDVVVSERSVKEIKIVEIDRETIEVEKKRIYEYLARNQTHRTLVKASVVTAGAVVAGHVAYHAFLKPAPVSTSVPNATLNDLVQKVDASRIEIAAVDAKFERLPLLPLPPVPVITSEVEATPTALGKVASAGKEILLAGWHGVKFFGTVMIQGGPPLVLSGLVLRELPTVADLWNRFITTPIGKVCHPIESKWFLKNWVHYKDMFKHLEYRVSGLPLAVDGFERDHFVSQTVTDVNVLTGQLARVVAFLEIQAERISKRNRVCGAHLTEKSIYAFKLIQIFNKDISVLLADRNRHAEVPACVATFRRKLKDEFDSFHLYERAALHDIVPL